MDVGLGLKLEARELEEGLVFHGSGGVGKEGLEPVGKRVVDISELYPIEVELLGNEEKNIGLFCLRRGMGGLRREIGRSLLFPHRPSLLRPRQGGRFAFPSQRNTVAAMNTSNNKLSLIA